MNFVIIVSLEAKTILTGSCMTIKIKFVMILDLKQPLKAQYVISAVRGLNIVGHVWDKDTIQPNIKQRSSIFFRHIMQKC